MPDSFGGVCSLWPGANPEGSILPLAFFKNVFDGYNFFIISNLFDSYKPKARIIINVRAKGITFGEALRIWVKKFKHNLPENYLKSTKKAITACKFSKIFRGSMPPDPLELLLVS